MAAVLQNICNYRRLTILFDEQRLFSTCYIPLSTYSEWRSHLQLFPTIRKFHCTFLPKDSSGRLSIFSQHIGTSSSVGETFALSYDSSANTKLALFLRSSWTCRLRQRRLRREQSERMSKPCILTSLDTKSFGERDREARRFDRHDYCDRWSSRVDRDSARFAWRSKPAPFRRDINCLSESPRSTEKRSGIILGAWFEWRSVVKVSQENAK